MDKIFLLMEYIIEAAAVLVAVSVHEFSKALTSTLLGDPMPKNEKRLTLNPFKHFELIGFLLLLFFDFGWGNPVRTSAIYYKNRKRDTVITYTVPILTSFIFGALLIFGETFLGRVSVEKVYLDPVLYLWLFLAKTGHISIVLAVCNLIPVTPFCGERILSSFMPPESSMRYVSSQGMLQMILLFLLFLGFVSPVTSGASNAAVTFFENIAADLGGIPL